MVAIAMQSVEEVPKHSGAYCPSFLFQIPSTMLNQSLPVASRTRRREAQLLKENNKSKKRKKQEERKAKTNMARPQSSSKGNISLASQKETDQVQVILIEESDSERQESEHEEDPVLIYLGSYDGNDDVDDDDEDDDPMEDCDEAVTSTSGEDNDESEDLDYHGEEEEDEDPLCSSSSDEEAADDDVEAVVLETSSHEQGKAGEVEFVSEHAGKGRKNSNGLDNLVDDDSAVDDVLEPSSSKTNSRHRKGLPASSNKLQLLKILADSILENDDDSGPSTLGEALKEDEETEDNFLPLKFTFGVEETITPEKTEFDKEMDSLWTEMQFCLTSSEIGSTGTNLVCSKTKSRHKKGLPASSNKLQLLTTLADSILENEDPGSSASEEALKEDEGTEDNFLPLKFTFGVEETITPEKTEFEKEMDSLWTEMQFCLTSSEIGSTRTNLVENDVADISEVKHDRATLCRQGNHQVVLDEEVGMICKFCSFVQLEIRYIAPPFMTDPCGKFERQYSGIVDFSTFDGLKYEDPDNDMPDCDPCANIKGTVWEIIPNLRSKLYPHQREGFEFIWTNIAGGIYRDKSKNSSECGGGCIVSHAPGTGKTFLTIVFLQTYLKEFPSCRPVILAPQGMLLTWEAEFRKWKVDIPFHNLNSQDFSGKEKTKGVDLYRKLKHGVPYPDRPLAKRLVKLLSWKSDGGILGISYRLFELLAGKDNKEKQKHTYVDKNVSKILLELPGLFVFDEGHTPRNDDSLLWRALSRIKTERRIILSGTPFQNNFDELFNTLSLVRPKFVEGIHPRHQEKVAKKLGCKRDEGKRKWTSLTGSIGKDDIYEAQKLREVRAVIKPFVHVHKGTILQTTLPGLRHSQVVLRPSNLQKKILELVKETKNPILLDYYASLISIHPSLLQQLSDQKDINTSVSSIVSMDELERIRLKPDKGVKTKFLTELLKLSEALDERVIVFSQYLEPLNLIMEQLKDFFKWKEGDEIFYMHGKLDIKQRQHSINAFNDPTSKARVLLASTKACSEGISLVGGSRVVLLDVTWNPSVERQAICRAYRLGQKKVVYTYHLISSGTMEGSKCCRQARKDRLSELLFSSSDKGDGHHKKVCDVLEDKILEEMMQHQKLESMFEDIIDQPKDSDFIGSFENP
ncbi:hypothetical protein REPUB_Repub03eG0272700 [Reevesia pubescens]